MANPSETIHREAETANSPVTQASGITPPLLRPELDEHRAKHDHHNRLRLVTALERMKATSLKLRDKTSEGAKVTDRCIRTHPYQTIGVAFILGLALGVLRRRSHKA